MINKEILNYDLNKLTDYIRNKAGSSDPIYFLCAYKGGLELQQIPEEYSRLLLWFKSNNFKKYLELGIGKGGSFLLNTYFQLNLELSISVDDCSYWLTEQKKSIEDKIDFLINEGKNVKFINAKTNNFFENNMEFFDCIFIDADHDYLKCKEDYLNSLKIINNGGFIILHDINSYACPGVVRIWKEIKDDNCIEFISSNSCGIGIKKINIL